MSGYCYKWWQTNCRSKISRLKMSKRWRCINMKLYRKICIIRYLMKKVWITLEHYFISRLIFCSDKISHITWSQPFLILPQIWSKCCTCEIYEMLNENDERWKWQPVRKVESVLSGESDRVIKDLIQSTLVYRNDSVLIQFVGNEMQLWLPAIERNTSSMGVSAW